MTSTFGESTDPAAEAASGSVGWQTGLEQELGRLGPWIRGRLLVDPPADLELVPATRYFDPEVLRDAIQMFRGPLVGSGRPRLHAVGENFELDIAAARFTRRYAGPMTAVALAGLAAGIGLDMSAERCSLGIGPGGHFVVALDAPVGTVLRCAERSTSWIADGPQFDTVDELRRSVWEKLYGAHLAPLFARLHELTGASEALLWASAAEYASSVAADAEEFLPKGETTPYLADRTALFDAAELPGVAGPNPIREAMDWIPVDGYSFPAVQTRRLCCLSYLLQERDGFLCSCCPYLPPDDRAALASEDNASSLGNEVMGPAAERSRQVGRQRASYRRLTAVEA